MAVPARPDDRRTKAVRATAGVAGALAFLGIGWAMGARATEAELAGRQVASGPGTEPAQPAFPYPGDDEAPSWGEWGTIPAPDDGGWGNEQPAFPGDGGGGGFLPPQTGSGGS
jgi:hypothetical protein